MDLVNTSREGSTCWNLPGITRIQAHPENCQEIGRLVLVKGLCILLLRWPILFR